MLSDRAALAHPCPRCHALEGEPCAGLESGSHTARVAAWQWAQRSGQAAHTPEQREAVRALIARIRATMADRGHAT